MHLRLVFLFAFSGLMLACSSSRYHIHEERTHKEPTSSKSLVQFEYNSSFAPIMQKASHLDKPIFLEFYTTWCAPCKLMDRDVFTHYETAHFLNDNFVNYKVNAEQANGPDLATIYGVKSFPTLLFLDETGKVLLRHEGVAYQKTLKEIGQAVLDQRAKITFGR